MTNIINTRSVLTLASASDSEGVYFSRLDEDADIHNLVHILDYDDWLDLGQPSEITVTVEPGDTLS